MTDACVEFRSLLEQKDREIIGTHERQVTLLQARISEQENEYATLESMFQQLQEDFKYNLALLDSRDVELEEYDALIASIEGALREKDLAVEELENILVKTNAENMKEREKEELCRTSLNHRICDLEKELQTLRKDNEEKLKKQMDNFKEIETELKREKLEREKRISKMEKREAELLKSFERQAQIAQERFESLKTRLQELELKDHDFSVAFNEKNKKIQDLYQEITKYVVQDTYEKQSYEAYLQKLRDDAKCIEKERRKWMSQEVENIKEMTKRLNDDQLQLDHFKDKFMEQLQVLIGKVKLLELEFVNFREGEVNIVQNIESKYLEFIKHHEALLEDLKQETLKWKKESDMKQRMCLDLEQRLSKVKELEAENQCLKDTVLQLKGENERIQKVVEALRLEMENLQDATEEEDQRVNRKRSNKSNEVQTENFQREIQALKGKISSMAAKLDAADISAPRSRKQLHSVHQSIKIHDSPDNFSSDEDMSLRLAELEQTQNMLKVQLESTIANAARIANERDILMELNNSLHAELNRTIHCGCHSHVHEDKGGLSGICCHDSGCTNQKRGPNSSMPCSSTWAKGCNSSDQKECGNATCSSLQKHPVQQQNVVASSNKLHVEGSAARYHERESGSDFIAHKGTISQHSNLRHLVRKQELNKPRVRNYNIKDDSMYI
ncbi:hypothetical protein KP509_1Z024900 [Ceratopteris richardii]|nr:hypothetical protein KP509_1Z024900 [Ceratopteris richardii]